MTMKQILYMLLAVLLVCMVTVSPALGGIVEEEKDKLTIIDGDSEDVEGDEEKETDSNDGSGTDKLLSDDAIFGYDVNDNYDITKDLSLQKAFDYASALPIWTFVIVVILLMVVLVLITYAIVILWNLFKGGKAATNENPAKAAQGIKDAKMVNRDYTAEVVEGVACLAVVCFFVLLLM